MDSRRHTIENNLSFDELTFASAIKKQQILAKILPSYTPNESINSLLEKTRPNTTRSITKQINIIKVNNSFEKEPYFPANIINDNYQSYLNITSTNSNFISSTNDVSDRSHHSSSSKFLNNPQVVKENLNDTSFNQGIQILKITSNRKCLEEQHQLMENRVKHLAKANNKIKQKINMTQKKN